MTWRTVSRGRSLAAAITVPTSLYAHEPADAHHHRACSADRLGVPNEVDIDSIRDHRDRRAGPKPEITSDELRLCLRHADDAVGRVHDPAADRTVCGVENLGDWGMPSCVVMRSKDPGPPVAAKQWRGERGKRMVHVAVNDVEAGALAVERPPHRRGRRICAAGAEPAVAVDQKAVDPLIRCRSRVDALGEQLDIVASLKRGPPRFARRGAPLHP